MDIGDYTIRPSKHFAMGWMRKWGYGIKSIRDAIDNAIKIEKVGKTKYEDYIRTKGGGRKIIFIKDDITMEILVITGAEGK